MRVIDIYQKNVAVSLAVLLTDSVICYNIMKQILQATDGLQSFLPVGF